MNMKKVLKTLIFTIVVLTVSFTASAQQEVKGVVIDEAGEPLPGVTVLIVESNTGIVTDVNGNYSIQAEQGSILQFSFIGMVNQTIKFSGQKNIDVTLVSEDIDIDEVVVIGYGQKKKVTITGSISTINSEEILKSPSASVTNSLAGRITGLAAVQNTGQPGADEATLFVRGVATLNDASPLTIVDGVERPFSQIDPEEIESISILKDASATAVYGVRGANGVIIVTTKRGEKGQAKISVSTSVGFQQPTILSEKANSYTYARALNERHINDGNDESTKVFNDEVLEIFKNGGNILYPDTDWLDYLFKDNTLQTKTNVTISGGTDKVRYFVSMGYLSQDGILNDLDPRYDENFKFNRYNYRSNLDIDLTKSTLLKVTLGGRTEIRNEPQTHNDGMWKIAGWAQPMAGSGVVDGKWVATASENVGGLELKDPLTGFYGKGYKNKTKSFLDFDLDVIQKLDFITRGLKVKMKGSYNTNYTHTKNRGSSPDRYESIIDPLDPDNVVLRKTNDRNKLGYSESTAKARNWYMEAAIDYNRKFGVHDFGGLLLYNQRVVYYPKHKDKFWPNKVIPNRTLGLVGRLTYNYKTKYLFDINLGYNGSENFPEDKRYGLFPAFSLGWIITEESFMDNIGFLDYLKIRGSYGKVGNDKLILPGDNVLRFLYLPDSWDYATGGYNFGYDLSQDQNGASELLIGNPYVTWETAIKKNIGFDAKFFGSKLSTSFDLFHEFREDILIQRQTVPDFVAANLPVVNMGEVENQGYEVEVKWMDKIGDFSYNLGVNLSYARNKILFKDEVPQPHDYLYETGNPVEQHFGFITNGFFTEEVNTTTDPNYPDHTGIRYPGDVIYKDLNNDGKIDDFDRQPVGFPSKVPEYNYGINAGMMWKSFDFSMTFAGVRNTSRIVPGTLRTPFGGQFRGLYQFQYDGRWTPETAETAKYPRFSVNSGANNYKVSDMFIRDASFLRLKNVELGYTLKSAGLKRIGLSNVRVYLNGFNLLTWSDFDLFDPESKPGSAGLYPMMKVYNMGVKFNF